MSSLSFPTEPQSIKQVIVNIIKVYLSTVIKLLPGSFLYALLIFMPNMIYGHKLLEKLTDWKTFTIVFLMQFVGLWIFLILLHRGMQWFMQSDTSYTASIHVASKKLLICLINGVLFLAVTLGGALLLIVPGVFLYILFLFNLPCIIFEGKGIVSAFKCSAGLTYNYWWRTFLISGIVFLVFLIFTIGFESLFTLSLRAFGGALIIQTLLSMIVTAFITPWVIAGLIVQYQDLKLRAQKDNN